MYLFYILSLLPIVAGLVLWIKNENVVWQEWLIGASASLLTAGMMHGLSAHALTGDTETWSGRVVQVEHYPRWVEQYQQRHTRTVESGRDSKGRVKYRTYTYYTTEHTTHPEHWEAKLNFGTISFNRNISEDDFEEIKKDFGFNVDKTGKQSTIYGGFRSSGDNSIYITTNKTDVIWPVTTRREFENRIKAAPSVFSFVPPPNGSPIFNYPENKENFVSDRVLGQAKSYFNLRKWDEMNSRLGSEKQVNVIVVGFSGNDSMLGQYQESKWVGGKKNDVVLTFGANNHKPTWVKVFGWTESETCKRNLETILLKNLGTTNDVISMIEKEIRLNYKIKDWSKFDYLSIEPTTTQLVWFLIGLALTQIGLYVYFHKNEYVKLNFWATKIKFQ